MSSSKTSQSKLCQVRNNIKSSKELLYQEGRSFALAVATPLVMSVSCTEVLGFKSWISHCSLLRNTQGSSEWWCRHTGLFHWYGGLDRALGAQNSEDARSLCISIFFFYLANKFWKKAACDTFVGEIQVRSTHEVIWKKATIYKGVYDICHLSCSFI